MLQQILTIASWPIATVVVCILAMLIFRQPLVRLIDRTRRVSKTGIEADAAPQDEKLDIKPSVMDELQRLFDNALILQREAEICADLERITFRDQSERDKFLIRVLAVVGTAQQFDRTYFWIWGSQLAVLQYLNSLGAMGSEQEVLRLWYDQAKGRDPELYEAYSFDKWLAFMQNHGLIRLTKTVVAITLDGREFLKYITHRGYPLYKAG